MQEMDQDKTVGCMCAGNDITGCTYANTNFSHVVLESAEPSEMSSDESILTLQREQTASAKSESDTSTNTEDEVSRQLSIYQMFMVRSLDPIHMPLIEYDVVSIEENEEDPLGESHHSSGSEVMKMSPAKLAVEDSDYSCLGSSEESSDRADSELSMKDYWSCMKCKESNNNPLFRFCERCYKVRKGFFPPRPFPVKTRDDLKKIRTERQIARRKRKNSESSDLSSAEGEATAKEQKVVCSQSTDSVISCWSQETLSGEVALSLPYASILERLQTKTLGKDLGLCGGIIVMDGKGDERVCDENVGRVDSCSVKTGTGKSAAGAATGGSKTPVASVESEPSSKVLCGVKRPAAESCSTLRKESILDEVVGGTSRDCKRPALGWPSSGSGGSLPDTAEVAEILCTRRRGVDEIGTCRICYSQFINATFLHGRTGHTVSCYSCALRIWKTKRTCPICNLKIKSVIKNFFQ